MYKNSSGSLTVNGETLESRSYSWYVLGMYINGEYVLNDYSYSSTTIKHVYKLRRFLKERGIQYRTIEAPKGLQNVDAAKQHYTDLIKSAQDVLNNPRRKKALDASRLSHLESLVQSLQFLNSVSF